VTRVTIGSEVYCVERCGAGYFVANVHTKKRIGPYPSARGADDIVAALRAEARRVALTGQAAKERRGKRAAYRLAASDRVLNALKRLLPRAGEIARTTRKSHSQVMSGRPSEALRRINRARAKAGWLPLQAFSFDQCMAAASSHPEVHAELQQSAGQRRTRTATTTRAAKGAVTRDQVAELWGALELAGIPPRARAGRIAALLGIDARHVRRLRK
jgi:hypothetical protein